jgi:penicillin-binding protein 1C
MGAVPAAYPRRPPAPAIRRRVARKRFDWRSGFGCLLRALFGIVFVSTLVALCGVSLMFVQYFRIARTLPDIANLAQHSSQFETTRILDRNGDLLYEIIDPGAGRRTYIPLSKISPNLVAATIATEDKGFYSHPGFDLTAIARAFWQNYRGGGVVSGASTITQQLARRLLFTPEERAEQSYERKLREAVLAAEITRRYSKDEILELYINEIYYGNLAYGIEAAAETYLGTSASSLTLGQASFLAGLPQAPAIYDVYTNPEAALARQHDVLLLMFEASQEQGCIYVSNSPNRVCVNAVDATNAANEIQNYPFKPPTAQMRYPHWVTYIRSLLEAQYDPQTIYRSGFTVLTSLDPEIQDLAQQAVSEQVQALAGHNAKNGALVAIRPSTGEILAMVGSPDFNNEAISGQVNMAINPRQPGSSIKPLTYLAAFEKGWTPATLIWDVPSEFPPSGRADDPSGPYVPVNYDERFHGPVLLRDALANSYNIPAVKALQYVGIYEDPERPGQGGLIRMAQRLGISTLTRSDYGLSLTLGGGEVTLLELTGAYAAIANSGIRQAPVAILRILDHTGKEVYVYQQPAGERVLRAEHTYLMTSILADRKARTPAFGANSALDLPFTVAAKTGTTNDFRDNWTLGYTPDLAVGVWIGNADYTPMRETSGLSGAAPVWNKVMGAAEVKLTGGNPTPFARPPGIVESVICAISGTSPSQWCPRQTSELFAANQPPLPADQDLWQKTLIDTWSGLRASPACSDFLDEQFALNVSDTFARQWIRKNPQGQQWASEIGFPPPVRFVPTRECNASDPRPTLVVAYPQDGETVHDSPLNIYAVVDVPQGFDYWLLEYGLGDKPVEWETLERGHQRIPEPNIIYSWDLASFPPQVITLRLSLFGQEGAYAERLVRLAVLVPTPTPRPTSTPVPPPPPPNATETPPWGPVETPWWWPPVETSTPWWQFP